MYKFKSYKRLGVNKLNKTREQGKRTLIAISIIAVAVYIGFEPLFEFVPSGVAQSVVGASFGAIFVIILTMYLLNKQTEIEQESKRGERVFDEKVQLYQSMLDTVGDMLMDGKISKEEVNKLPFPLIRLSMLGRDETIEAFKDVNKELNSIYSSSDDDVVVLGEDQKQDVYELLAKFASKCRLDLEIGDEATDQLIKSTVDTITSTGKKKRDMTKFSFDGKDYPKNRYLHKVIQNFVEENPNMSLREFSEIVPQTTDFKREFWVTYEEAKAVEERQGRKRHFSKPDEVIQLKDAKLCVSNGTTQETTLLTIEFFKKKGIRTK